MMRQSSFAPYMPSPKTPLFHTVDAADAVAHATKIYDANTSYLRNQRRALAEGEKIPNSISACYPYFAIDVRRSDIRLKTIDTRASHGFVSRAGRYGITVTRPDFFKGYLTEQLGLLVNNHRVKIEVGVSTCPIPLKFAFNGGETTLAPLNERQAECLETVFDFPKMAHCEDNSSLPEMLAMTASSQYPLSSFSGPRVDVSMHQLIHYTGTMPEDFQNFIILTNYEMYVQEFNNYAQKMLSAPNGKGYTKYIAPYKGAGQMPAHHLVRPDGNGITLVNIGVGNSNAKNMTDQVAILRPHAVLMLGHCAGLQSKQKIGDYVLPNGFMRADHILDNIVPLNVPIPVIAEVQQALVAAARHITNTRGNGVKKFLRTGTVITIDDRGWERRDNAETEKMIRLSCAIGLDMETATVATNCFRWGVPYAALLCVSDKPVQGMMKLPGAAQEFYARQRADHFKIGIAAMEALRNDIPSLHSRKLSNDSRIFL